MIRVDQAGEYGATQIYKGQLAILSTSEKAPIIKHMLEQEYHHLDQFSHLMVRRRVRPTILSPVWQVLGYALGVSTALLGEKAAMACTVAVEEVIDQHYQEQLEALNDKDPELTRLIKKCQAEELEHRDIGLENGAEQTLGYSTLKAVIKTGSRLAIWLSKKL